VESTSDVVQFLRSRRARITPEQAGLPSYGRRQVPGLRREEVASLAGVSVEYYKRLERGHLSGVSDAVLEALARALRLDDAERAHLFDLARAASPLARGRRRPAQQRVRPMIQQMLDSIQLPAIVGNTRCDWLAANRLGHALCAPVFDSQPQPPNAARFTFLDPSAIDFYPDWDEVADQIVAHLRSATGHDPYDRDLSDLVAELATHSDEFRTRWSAHDVRFHRTGVKRIHHPVVGDLELRYETMQFADDALVLSVFTAEADSTSQHGLDILASRTAPSDQVHAATVSHTGTA
jgi:transcriptional regulator with XRE-family HTH domain